MTTVKWDDWNATVQVGDIVQRNVEGHWLDWWEIRQPEEKKRIYSLWTGPYQYRHRIVRVLQ